MRFHVPGLPHTITNRKYIHCAFTQKVFKLCKMLHSMGHEVYHYGCEGSNPTCTEHVDVIEDEFRRQFYPDEWHDKQWDYDIQDECHKVFYKNTIEEIKKRKGKHDFFLAGWGWGHKPISDALGNSVLTVEPGIGYKDTFCKYRVFESYNWMSYVYGRGMPNKKGQLVSVENGNYFDAVVPNYFDPDDFDFTPDDKEDYFLYLGRIIKRKGVEVVQEIARATGIHVKLAGQGSLNSPPSTRGEIIEYVGFADADKRRELLRKAKGLLMPTVYVEPFGGVSIESMISGTPVICTDWGVFPETILHGITGYRCRTLDHFVWAVNNIQNISPQVCRDYALENYSLERVSSMYQEYFDMLSTLWDKKGWYLINGNRENMSWLERYLPEISPNSKTDKTITAKPESIIYPEEKEPNYTLNLSWYEKEKKPGISFIMRAKNEESTIGLALDSLKQLKVPYEINLVLNQCTDGTEYEASVRSEKNGQNINIYHYPFQLGKTGLENQCTPVTSVHSTIWLLNWIMMKGNHEYTFRWDSDFIMTSALSRDVEKAIADKKKIANISAIFSDTGKPNTEPYLWANELYPRYTRYSLWHLTRFAVAPSKTVTLNGKIIHDSPLKDKKDYWETEPWWENEEREETKELKKKAKEKYEQLKNKIGEDCTINARASCPDSEELARRVQKIVGADIDEISALKAYASHTDRGK